MDSSPKGEKNVPTHQQVQRGCIGAIARPQVCALKSCERKSCEIIQPRDEAQHRPAVTKAIRKRVDLGECTMGTMAEVPPSSAKGITDDGGSFQKLSWKDDPDLQEKACTVRGRCIPAQTLEISDTNDVTRITCRGCAASHKLSL